MAICSSIIRKVSTKTKTLALTFDDGPNPPYTEDLLRIFERHRVKVTFFFIGRQIEKHPEIVKNAFKLGHEIGNHSYSHQRMSYKSPKFVVNEIVKTDRLIQNITGQKSVLFRSPFGKNGLSIGWSLRKLKRKNILWNLIPDPPDYLSPSADLIAKSVIQNAQPGSIVLLHDGQTNRTQTVRATEEIIVSLLAEGYSFSRVSDLLSPAEA